MSDKFENIYNKQVTRLLSAFVLVFLLGQDYLVASCKDGTQPSGAKYRICIPDTGWNRQLVIYAHGYVDTDQPIAIPEDQLATPDGTSLPAIANSLGYAFAVSSYRTNGLAVLQGLEDLKELSEVFTSQFGKPDSTFLTGVSEGGLIATLSVERFPMVYSAAVAACGPIGSFTGETNYIGDARLLFDYYFPGTLPGNVISVPSSLRINWEQVYVPAIQAVLKANPRKMQNYLNASLIPTGADQTVTMGNIVSALRYSAIATNDAASKLGGQPYDNRTRYYFGTSNDLELNTHITRYSADPAAILAMKGYETSGKPQVPVVTVHTIADPIVPWSHEFGYAIKTQLNNNSNMLTQLPVFQNGHCNFSITDILFAFIVMVSKAQGVSPKTMVQNLTETQQQQLPGEVRNRLALQ